MNLAIFLIGYFIRFFILPGLALFFITIKMHLLNLKICANHTCMSRLIYARWETGDFGFLFHESRRHEARLWVARWRNSCGHPGFQVRPPSCYPPARNSLPDWWRSRYRSLMPSRIALVSSWCVRVAYARGTLRPWKLSSIIIPRDRVSWISPSGESVMNVGNMTR